MPVASIQPGDILAALRRIDSCEGNGATRLALQIAPHVFVRPGELRTARWEELDLDGAIWTVPAEKTKMRKPHAVPLSRQSLSIFTELRAITGGKDGYQGFVFPSIRTWLRPMSENTLNAALRRLGYRQVATEEEGRQQAIERGLNAGTIDAVKSEEPFPAAYRAPGKVTPLYRLLDRASTERVLGASSPAQSLLTMPRFMQTKPMVAQRVVDAFVCAMRFVNARDAAGIVACLRADYLKGKDKAGLTREIAKALPTFAKRDYRIRPTDAALVVRAIETFHFDSSGKGKWREYGATGKIDPSSRFGNRMVENAMRHAR